MRTEILSQPVAASNVLDQLTRLPNIEHPLVAGGIVAATAAAIALEVRTYNRTNDGYAAPFSNSALLEQSIFEAGGKQNGAETERRHRLQRMVPTVGATLGAGMIAAGLFGGFTYDNKASNPNAQAVAVLDSSYSMRRTADMGNDNTTRYEAAIQGIASSGYEGHLAILDSGQTAKLRLPMSSDWKDKLNELKSEEVDPNGGELAQAVNDAVSLLPIEQSAGGKKQREGTVLVVSDGTIASTSEEMNGVAQRVKKAGVNVRFVMPGTSTGSYSVNGSSPIKSGVRPQSFEDFNSKQVVQTSDKDEVARGIENALKSEAVSAGETSDWQLPLWIGGILLGSSMVGFIRQSVRKVI